MWLQWLELKNKKCNIKMRLILFIIAVLLCAPSFAQNETYIEITTAKNIGENISLSLKANSAANEALIWIDINGNGQKDSGEEVTTFGANVNYQLQSQTLKIYGPVWVLSCAYNKITQINLSPAHPNLSQIWCSSNQISELDLSNNTNISYLSCQSNKMKRLVFNTDSKIKTVSFRNNEFSEQAVTELINSLPVREADAGAELIALDAISSAEKNIITRGHIDLALSKNWTIINHNGGNQEVYNPTDIGKNELKVALYQYFGFGNTYPVNNIEVPEVEIISKTQTSDYEYWKIKYLVDKVGDIKDYSYAYLIIPPASKEKPLPLILALHPTANIGKDRAMGIYATPPADSADSLLRAGRQYGHELGLKNEFIVFVPDRAAYGERRLLSEDIPYTEQMTAFQNYLKTFRPGWRLTAGKNVWDLQRALDFLLDYDFVDKENVGAIGHSLGAADAIMLQAVDDRVKTAVVNSGSSLNYKHDIWTEENALRAFVANASTRPLGEQVNLMFMLSAGKSMLYLWSIADSYDTGGPNIVEGFRTIKSTLDTKWRRYGKSDVALYLHNNGHDFPAEARALSYQWLKEKLQYTSSPNSPSSVEDVKKKATEHENFELRIVNDEIYIKIKNMENKQYPVKVINLSGQVIYSQTVNQSEFVISNLAKGIYVINIDDFSQKIEML